MAGLSNVEMKTADQAGRALPATDHLVLASASPRRRFLLEQLGLRFEVCPAQVQEHEEPDSCPRETVLHNARLKAAHVAALRPGELVLGSDTTVALEDEVLHKPADLAEARVMLRKLSGRAHTVYTGIALRWVEADLDEAHFVTSEVVFHALDNAAIDAYFHVVNPLDKAGAYGIQEGRERIIADLRGSLHNVMGLPTEFLRERLEQLGLWAGLEARP